MRPRNIPIENRLAFGPRELAELTGIDHRTIRQAIRSGDLRAVRLGRRFVIPRSAALAFIGEPAAPPPGAPQPAQAS